VTGLPSGLASNVPYLASGVTPMVYRKVIKVSDDVFRKLKKLEKEFGVNSANKVLKCLLKMYRLYLDNAVLYEGKTVKEFLRDINHMVDRVTPFYVIHECGRLAHFLRANSSEAWYYCPECNLVFKKQQGNPVEGEVHGPA